MKEKIKDVIEFIKVNLNLILLIPTVLGGLWQIVELASIGPSYIRFFSLTQLIPDGILILFLSASAYAVIKILFWYSSRKYNEELDRDTPPPLFKSLIGFGLSIFILIAYGYNSLIEIYHNSPGLFVSLSLLLTNLIFISVMLLFLLRVIRHFTFRYNDKLHSFLERPTKKSKIKQIIKNIFPYFATIIIVIFFKIIIFDLSGVLRIGRDKMIIPDELQNGVNVEKAVNCEFGIYSNSHFLYMNDRYIFYKIYPSTDSSKVVVLEFSSLFKNESCK